MSKITKIILTITVWFLVAFAMTFLYEYLHEIGVIYDNPENIHWNSRKVLFGIFQGAMFIMLIVKIIDITDND